MNGAAAPTRWHDALPSRQNSAVRTIGTLPDGDDKAVLHTRRKAIRTVVGIVGGWAMLIVSCVTFKLCAIKYSLHAPDRLAEYFRESPTAAAQWFTFGGVFLGELALVLWGHAISYMAFRRLAYGKTRTELGTFAAWNEMSRAGYTLSRRRPLWPVCTVIVWIGNTFLPAGFTTLVSPKSMIKVTPYHGLELNELSQGFASAIAFLPAKTFPNPANLSCGSEYVSNFWTFASHPATIFDPCPSLDDVQTLIMAGRAKLEASANQSDPLFKLPGSVTYVGGTGGTATLGPLGIVPWSSWQHPPASAPRPRGYNYTYTLEQQGLTTDVKCWQPKTAFEKKILLIEKTTVPHLIKTSLRCSRRDLVTTSGAELGSQHDKPDVSYRYVGSSSLVLMACAGRNAQGEDDPDAATFFFKDAGAMLYGNQGSELGGDLLCELRPKWKRNIVTYNSDRNWVTVEPVNGSLAQAESMTGRERELAPGPQFDPTLEANKQAYFAYYARLLTVQIPLAAVANAFVYTGSLSALINSSHPASKRRTTEPLSSYFGAMQAGLGNDVDILQMPLGNARPHEETRSSVPLTLSTPATQILNMNDLSRTVLFGKDSAIQSLAAFNARINAGKVKTWIQPCQVEAFIQGVFEYAATSQREWFQHYVAEGGILDGTTGMENISSTVDGSWHAQTIGWGASSDSSTELVLISLIPLLLFALVSCAMVGYSHWIDAPRGDRKSAPDVDPTDWLEAVVASAQGGLKEAFPPNALQRTQGIADARNVRVRLGQIIDEDLQEKSDVRLGFVCAD